MKPAYTTFASYLAKDHDHKGAQLGQIEYNNGTVGHDGFSYAICLTDAIRAGQFCDRALLRWTRTPRWPL